MLEILRPGKKTHILAGDRILGLFASKKIPIFHSINPHLKHNRKKKLLQFILVTCRENNGSKASLFTGIIHTALNLIANV
jgi:hypothetical protein